MMEQTLVSQSEQNTNGFSDVIYRAEGITRVFPGTVALENVDFTVYRGKVNVLVGENGAGKSTLMKILAGIQQPTSGRLVLEGQEISVKGPKEAEHLGISIIHQEMNLFPNLSVSDNIFMAREMLTNSKMTVDKRAQNKLAAEYITRLGHSIKPDALVSNLRIGQQQIVEIAKAISQNAKILIMDEPTSALSTAEVEVLFKVIRDLRQSGVTIIYISHKLDELLQIGDYITVLRDGRKVAERKIEGIDVTWIVEQMVGNNVDALFKKQAHHQAGETLLEAKNITLPRVGGGYTVNDVSFDLHKGEILGLYGLMGAGRTELMECIFGARPEATGSIHLNSREIKSRTVSKRIAEGITLVPEDRQRDGLIQTLSVEHNMLLASLKNYFKRGFLHKSMEKSAVQGMKDSMGIRVSDVRNLITSLSGGNQQKVVVAKSLLTNPKVLMLDEPTRGIDVGAKTEIFDIVNRLAKQGYGILLVTSEIKEIVAISDRVIVLSKGKITGEFVGDEITEENLVAASVIGYNETLNNNSKR